MLLRSLISSIFGYTVLGFVQTAVGSTFTLLTCTGSDNTTCYYLTDTKMNWQQSRDACRDNQIQLAKIELELENNYVWRLLEDAGIIGGVYIGAYLSDTSDHHSGHVTDANCAVYHVPENTYTANVDCHQKHYGYVCASTDASDSIDIAINQPGQNQPGASWYGATQGCEASMKRLYPAEVGQDVDAHSYAIPDGTYWVKQRVGMWRWVDGSPVDFYNWMPQTTESSTERCVELDPENGKWNIVDCDLTTRKAVCVTARYETTQAPEQNNSTLYATGGFVSSTEAFGEEDSSSLTVVYVSVSVGIVICITVVVVLIFVFCFYRRKRERKQTPTNQDMLSPEYSVVHKPPYLQPITTKHVAGSLTGDIHIVERSPMHTTNMHRSMDKNRSMSNEDTHSRDKHGFDGDGTDGYMTSNDSYVNTGTGSGTARSHTDGMYYNTASDIASAARSWTDNSANQSPVTLKDDSPKYYDELQR